MTVAVIAKTAAEKLRAWAKVRGWRNSDLRLLSSSENDFNADMNMEHPDRNRIWIKHQESVFFEIGGQETSFLFRDPEFYCSRRKGYIFDESIVEFFWIWRRVGETSNPR